MPRPLPPELLEQLDADPHTALDPDRIQPREDPHEPDATEPDEDLEGTWPGEALGP